MGLKIYADSGPGSLDAAGLGACGHRRAGAARFRAREYFPRRAQPAPPAHDGLSAVAGDGRDPVQGPPGLRAGVRPLLRSGVVLRQPAAAALRPDLCGVADEGHAQQLDEGRGPEEFPGDAVVSGRRLLDQPPGIHRPCDSRRQRRPRKRDALERLEHRAVFPLARQRARRRGRR